MQMLISVKLSFLRHPVLFMYFILLPRNGIVLKLRPHVSPSYSAVFFSWQNWGKMNLFLQELFCDLFCNRQVAYIICCSCSHTKTQHLECDCLLLLTTDMNGFSISPSHPLWCRNWCSMSSMIHSSFPFCFLSVSKSFVDCRCWTGVTIFSAKSWYWENCWIRRAECSNWNVLKILRNVWLLCFWAKNIYVERYHIVSVARCSLCVLFILQETCAIWMLYTDKMWPTDTLYPQNNFSGNKS